MSRILISQREVCRRAGLSKEALSQVVEQGIVEPSGGEGEQWQFDADYVLLLRRALRLHLDLGMDWPGVALVLELLDERDQLRREVEHLRRRLQRLER